MTYLHCRTPNPRATLHHAEYVHIAQAWIQIPTQTQIPTFGMHIRTWIGIRVRQCKLALRTTPGSIGKKRFKWKLTMSHQCSVYNLYN